MKGLFKRGKIWCVCDRNQVPFGAKCEVCSRRRMDKGWKLKRKPEIKKELSRDEIMINMNGM